MAIISAMKANSGSCPCWGASVCVQGLYREIEDGSWSFSRAECPIIENSRLPVYDQAEEYKYMRCSDYRKCPLYTQFQPSITSDK